jgi:hypothetical protein
MSLLRPSASALRDLAAIRRRLLARDIEALGNGPGSKLGERPLTEGLWILRPHIQSFAARMIAHDFDFEAHPGASGGAWEVVVSSRSPMTQSLPGTASVESVSDQVEDSGRLDFITPASMPNHSLAPRLYPEPLCLS